MTTTTRRRRKNEVNKTSSRTQFMIVGIFHRKQICWRYQSDLSTVCIIAHIETEIITEKGSTDANLKEMFSSIVNGHTNTHTHTHAKLKNTELKKAHTANGINRIWWNEILIRVFFMVESHPSTFVLRDGWLGFYFSVASLHCGFVCISCVFSTVVLALALALALASHAFVCFPFYDFGFCRFEKITYTESIKHSNRMPQHTAIENMQ